MKKALLTAAILVLGAAAHADGFLCESPNGNLNIKVFHHTTPKLGTRNAAIMVVSDPSALGAKTIATFNSDSALLTSSSATYMANVDLRYKTSNNKDAEIGGTTLGNLDQIVLVVDYSFSSPVPAGTEVPAEAILTQRSGGDDIRIPMSCSRYLKGE